MCAVLCLSLTAAPAVRAHDGAEVPAPSTVELVGGKQVVFQAHGDRIAPGSDRVFDRMARRMPRFAAKLPVTWCGSSSAPDDTVHASFTGPRFKVVYAYAADRPNRFDVYKDLIQDDVSNVREWVAAASGGVKTVRFDTGNDCGPEYLDITVVRLPQIRASYLASPSRAEMVANSVQTALAAISGTYDLLVYADDLYAGDGVTGSGMLAMDDRHGIYNDSNSGGATAMIWGDGSAAFGDETKTTLLHEITHNMGGVQDSAPHSTLAGHCFEMWDVMCYPDGGPRGQEADLFLSCSNGFPLPYECGSDDYFNPTPAPGSYLAANWNVYDSVFLCPVASCVASSAGTPPTDPTPPVPGPAPGPGEAPDPGQSVGLDAEAWLTTFLGTARTKVTKVGLKGLARGKAVGVSGQPPAGYSVQLDLLWGAAAIAGGSLDAAGKTSLKIPRAQRRLLSKRRKVRLTLQGVIRGSAGGGPPSVKRLGVTLKKPAPKKRRR
jgi:hypothetical protein